jgi:predicted acetyltransferase
MTTTTANSARPIALVPPSRDHLPGYVEALRRDWSPNTMHNVSREQLALYDASPDRLIAELTRQDGVFTLGDGTKVPRLPSRVRWIFDGAFCGAINLRFVPGTEDLPPTCSGHIGYAIVPWRQRRGYATRALALMLPVAHSVGLARVLVTCDDDNVASRKVIEANGGVLSGVAPPAAAGEKPKLQFWIATSQGGTPQPPRQGP